VSALQLFVIFVGLCLSLGSDGMVRANKRRQSSHFHLKSTLKLQLDH